MALKTASVVELRTENSDGIVELSKQLEQSSFPYRGKDRSVAARLDKLFDRRLEIENAAATLAQRESFGLENWNNSFVRLREVRVPPGCPLSEDALRTELWKLVPSGKFKRFQELFSDPSNFVVPAFVFQRGRIEFVGNPNLRALSVAGCLVSPDRIPDEFTEGLGLVKFTEKERRSPLLRYLRKADVEIIDRLKILWDAAEAVSNKDFRVLLVRRPGPEVIAQYSRSWDFPRGLHGTILFNREDFSDRIQRKDALLGPSRVNPRRIQHFKTIYDAYRKTLHASCGYRVEREELSAIAARGGMALRRIAEEYRRGAPEEVKSGIRAQVTTTLQDGVRMLHGAIDGHKARARDLMALVGDFKDSTGRVNPSVVGSRLAYSGRSLASRLSEMRAKNSHNQTDEDLLGQVLREEFTILNSIAVSLARNAAAVLLPQRGRGTYNQRPLVEGMTPEAVIERLMPDRGSLPEVGARPFSTFAGLLRIAAADLESGLRRREYDAARTTVAKMHVITRLFLVNDHIQRMTDYLVNPESVPMAELRREMRDIKSVLNQPGLPGVQVESHHRQLRTLADQISELDGLLTAGPRGFDGDRIAFYKALKKRLDTIVPEKIAWGFVPANWRSNANGGRATQ